MIFRTRSGEYILTYDSCNNMYQVLEDEAVIKESKSYQVIEKFLETGGEKKGKPKRLDVKVWLYKYGEYTEAIITSHAENNYREVWVMCDGKRTKEYISSCYKYIDINVEYIKKINELNQQIKDLNEITHQTRISMERIDVGDLIEKGT